MKSPVKVFAALAFPLALTACGGATGTQQAVSTPLPADGPAADYPMVIGAPYVIDGVEYVPADVMNYDQVGAATLDSAGGTGITGESRTLPLPSYVEVTSLETGRTILVRVERRGPMHGSSVIGLSSGALRQLSAAPGTPVRVRRVNPIEAERAVLRRGEAAPDRMATPMALVEVLRRKLPDHGGVSSLKQLEADGTTPPVSEPTQPDTPVQVKKPVPPKPVVLPPATEPQRVNKSADTRQLVKRGFAVQAGAFAVEANAQIVAGKIGGSINRQGNLFVVRTGPFPTQNDASASLAKVKAAGYSSARIYRVE